MDIKRNFLTAYFLLSFAFIPAYAQISYWTGDGGRGMRITVAEPRGIGLSAEEQSLIPQIQNTIIGSFNRYSAMTVFDRQNLENILREQRLSMDFIFSDTDYIRIGHLTNANLVLFGSITKISNNYILEIAITDIETGERKVSYLPKQVSLLALENLSAVREASADLLGQLGINLTANALQELRSSADTAKIQGENALAKSMAAQRQGSMAEAYTYIFQAAELDPTLRAEALNRISVMSANVSSGILGQAARNRQQEHDEWRTIVNAARNFYANHLPYEFVYDTNIWQVGSQSFERRTANYSINISLIPTDAWKTINDLRQGLSRARRNDTWNFSLDQIGPREITVTVQIINENNTVLSTASHRFSNTYNSRQPTPGRNNATLTFRNVSIDNFTDRVTIRVTSINEIPAQRAGETGLIQILSLSDYDRRIREAERLRMEQEAADRMERAAAEARFWASPEGIARREREVAEGQVRREREAAEAQIRRDREAAEAQARIRQETLSKCWFGFHLLGVLDFWGFDSPHTLGEEEEQFPYSIGGELGVKSGWNYIYIGASVVGYLFEGFGCDFSIGYSHFFGQNNNGIFTIAPGFMLTPIDEFKFVPYMEFYIADGYGLSLRLLLPIIDGKITPGFRFAAGIGGIFRPWAK